MRTALIGHSGFVGGSLLRQTSFDELFSSATIGMIDGRRFDLVVCAGARAEKWRANADPAGDRAQLADLMGHLATVECRELVLISTIDVYPKPRGVDEESAVSPADAEPYGRHRFELETFARARFGTVRVVRLGALFGEGLKKNFVFDLLNGRSVDGTDSRSQFQFYDTARLWSDIAIVRAAGLSLANLATAPVPAWEIASRCFGQAFENHTAKGPVFYDMQTRWAGLWGRTGPYLEEREEVLAGLERFVRRTRAGSST